MPSDWRTGFFQSSMFGRVHSRRVSWLTKEPIKISLSRQGYRKTLIKISNKNNIYLAEREIVYLEEITNTRRKIDYALRHERYEKIGTLGEKLVIDHEIKKLKDAKLEYLSKKVRLSESDRDGYDIDSFDENGNPIFIEVKTTERGNEFLFISENEIKFAENNTHNWYLYRCYLNKENNNIKIFSINKCISEILDLDPLLYKAKIRK